MSKEEKRELTEEEKKKLREEAFAKKLEELKKRDPFIYRNF